MKKKMMAMVGLVVVLQYTEVHANSEKHDWVIQCSNPHFDALAKLDAQPGNVMGGITAFRGTIEFHGSIEKLLYAKIEYNPTEYGVFTLGAFQPQQEDEFWMKLKDSVLIGGNGKSVSLDLHRVDTGEDLPMVCELVK